MKLPFVHFLAAFFAMTFSSVVPGNTQAQELSAEGKLRKSAHEFLFNTFAADRRCDYSDDKAILKEVVVSTKRVQANGELVIELPEGAQRIASMFRHLVL